MIDDSTFRATVTVVPSSTFFAWVAEFRGHIRVEGPADVALDFTQLLINLLDEQDEMIDRLEKAARSKKQTNPAD